MHQARAIGLASILTACAHAGAQSLPQAQPHEQYVPPPAHEFVAPRLAPNSMPTIVQEGPYTSVQVNTSLFGANLPNDAANEPSLAIDPTAPNRMVIGWRQFDNINSSFRESGWAYSHDGGRSWVFTGPIQNQVFRSDPVLGSDSQGRFYYYSLRVVGESFQCDMYVSEDGGVTWGEPNFAFGGDKAWFAVDRTGGESDGHVYAWWQTAGNQYFPGQFSRSVDGGVTWEDPIPIGVSTPRFGTIAVARNGDIYFPSPGQFCQIIKSSNAKDADQTPTFQLVGLANLGGGGPVIGMGPNPGGLLGQADIAVDAGTGPHADNVYVVCSVRPPQSQSMMDPLEVGFSRSTNGGALWSPGLRVNDDPPATEAWQWFAAMDVAPNGRIDVVWLDTRDDPTPRTPSTSALYYAHSDDGGQTFSANVKVSPSFNHSVGYPQQNKLGDYIDIVSDDVGASVAYAATFNGEQDVYFLRIGDYDCNQNGIGDETDLLSGGARDCNENGIPDSCEITAGTLADTDSNGIPDACSCAGDLTTTGENNGTPDGVVDLSDLLFFVNIWDADQGASPSSDADLTTTGAGEGLPSYGVPDGEVDLADLLFYVNLWDAGRMKCP